MFFDRYCKGIRNGWESTPRVRIEVQDHFDITAKGLSERCAIARTTLYRFNMSRTLSRGNEGPSQENLSRLGPFYHHPMISSDRLCHQTDARIRSLIFAG